MRDPSDQATAADHRPGLVGLDEKWLDFLENRPRHKSRLS